MKTPKVTKQLAKPAKTSVTKKPGKINSSKFDASEGKIREKAMEIFQQRIENDIYGTPEGDWLQAEKYFKNS